MPGPLRSAATFALAYGAAIGLASIAGALLLRRGIEADLALALLLFAGGAATGGFLASLAMAGLARRKPRSARLALSLVALILLTTGFQVVFFYGNYMSYYVAWWGDPFTADWFFPLIITFFGAGFYYLALGLPMMLPIGFPVLIGAAFWLSRMPGSARLPPGDPAGRPRSANKERPVH